MEIRSRMALEFARSQVLLALPPLPEHLRGSKHSIEKANFGTCIKDAQYMQSICPIYHDIS